MITMPQKISNTKTTFRSTPAKETFDSCVIYLLECLICKIQYVGKSEVPFNVILNNGMKEKNSNVTDACKDLNKNKHTLDKHMKL